MTIDDVHLHKVNGWNVLSTDGYTDEMQQLWKEVTHAHSHFNYVLDHLKGGYNLCL